MVSQETEEGLRNKQVSDTHSPRTREAWCGGPRCKTPGWSGDAKQERGALGPPPFIGASAAVGVISSCQVPGPGMIKAEDYCLQGHADLRDEVWLWTSLHIKGTL